MANAARATVRVILPGHLRRLAGLHRPEVSLAIPLPAAAGPAASAPACATHPVTLGAVLDALEAGHPALRGLLREPGTLRLRPYVRVFAGPADLTPQGPDAALPPEVCSGAEPLRIVGAVAGGR